MAVRIASLDAEGVRLQANGAAIYATRPWAGSLPSGGEINASSGAEVYYTARQQSGAVFAIFFSWPEEDGVLRLSLPRATAQTTATLLGTGERLLWAVPEHAVGVSVTMGKRPPAGSRWAWVVELGGLAA